MFCATRAGLFRFSSPFFTSSIYVGNISYKIRSKDLETKFSKFGPIESATVVMDRDTDRSKGFGFVKFASSDAAERAIKEMDGLEVDGRQLRVNMATTPRD
eukprot:TRINITY_DN14817_c0_g1_i1.p1 TRINITY_DN14817_c0_g1~~TRINITY_DN14817_c0_g1_i1.p1  ORF type:complete len:108 (-),score=19.75 TRINITY_DN14817_c0_g1_i1:128-430(-)